MNGFWDGVLVTIMVIIGVPAVLAVAAALMFVWFQYGADLVKPKPLRPKDRLDRAHHATIIYCADRVSRIFWIAGIGFYVYQHRDLRVGGESRFADVRHAIMRADEKWAKRHGDA